jgi:hypothetical protein
MFLLQSVAVALALVMIVGMLFVVLDEVAVRKLRKNPETKSILGMEFVSGWGILNVVHALSWPRSFMGRAEKGPLLFLHAKSE